MIRKIVFFLLVALAILVSPRFTKAQTPRAGASATSQTLIALENRWVGALQNSDTATLDSILADTYVDTDENGQRTDKQGVLSALKSGDLKFQSVKVSGMHVRAYGEAAVVTGTGTQQGTFKGQPLTPTIVFTDTFIRLNGRWQAVASH